MTLKSKFSFPGEGLPPRPGKGSPLRAPNFLRRQPRLPRRWPRPEEGERPSLRPTAKGSAAPTAEGAGRPARGRSFGLPEKILGVTRLRGRIGLPPRELVSARPTVPERGRPTRTVPSPNMVAATRPAPKMLPGLPRDGFPKTAQRAPRNRTPRGFRPVPPPGRPARGSDEPPDRLPNPRSFPPHDTAAPRAEPLSFGEPFPAPSLAEALPRRTLSQFRYLSGNPEGGRGGAVGAPLSARNRFFEGPQRFSAPGERRAGETSASDETTRELRRIAALLAAIKPLVGEDRRLEID
jgi:hypothetical protein